MALRGPLVRLLRTKLRNTLQQSRGRSVAVVGAPFSKGQKRIGAERGPRAIRDAGLIHRLSALDDSVHDFGDLTFRIIEEDDPYMDVNNPRNVGGANKMLSGAVSRAVGAGYTLVMLGGDHSLAIGSVGGHAKQCPDLCVIWVDAHADLNTPMTSPSGNLHGQPLAFLLKEMQDKVPVIPGLSWVQPVLSARDLVYIGLRDVDPGEHHYLKSLGIQHFTMRDIDRLGIRKVMEVTFDHLLARRQRPIHLSFDIDAFDPALAPATGTPVNGGLTYREGIYITEDVHSTGLLSVMDVVEVNPVLGANREAAEATASLAVDIVASALGQARDGALVSVDEAPAAKEDTEQLRL